MSNITHRIISILTIAVGVNTSLVSSTLADTSLALEIAPNVKLSGLPGRYDLQYTQVLGGPQTNWVTVTSLFFAGGVTNYVDYSGVGQPLRFYRALSSTNFPSPAQFSLIPPGTFTMGSPQTEAERQSDETQHTVILTNWFYMSRYEVRQGEYLQVVGVNPSYWPGDTNRPVENVSWSDATNYCRLLTAQELAAGRLPSGWVYRLPTESEWEYACRAGTTTAFHYGNALRAGMANFDATQEYSAAIGTISTNTTAIGYVGRTTAVGSYAPNAFGLYDMHGNVWEWCQDVYSDVYPTDTVVNPTGPSGVGNHVTRGGNWRYGGARCRSAERDNGTPAYGLQNIGFRPVLAPGQP